MITVQDRVRAWAKRNGLDPLAVTATYDGDAIVEINGSAEYAREAMAIDGGSVIAEIEAEARAADLAANGERYALQNQYLTLCDQLTGGTSHAKLGFAELQAIITAMQSTDPMQAMTLALQLLTLDAALKRVGGLQWWDNCEWKDLP